jgi:hypothetical protein
MYPEPYLFPHALVNMPQSTITESSPTEGQLALAIDTLKQAHFSSVRGAAKAYDVRFSTLY